MTQLAEMATQLQPGMYVRLPLETGRSDTEFRDFALGQIVHVNLVANTAEVNLYGTPDDIPGQLVCSLEHISRCFILPDSPFTLSQTQENGHILCPCNEIWQPEHLLEYFVQIEGRKDVVRIHEGHLKVTMNRQDSNPIHQIKSYEFQNPIWKFPRDRVISSYSELRNATFGIEELVGTRLMLLAHQAETISRVLGDTTNRYLLADEVGLGKTIEACVILKGLLRRDPLMKTLIVAPATLARQWQNELNTKFWMTFPFLTSVEQLSTKNSIPGYIISTEELEFNDGLWNAIRQQHWGLYIVDEAHHLHKSALLYQRIYILSKSIERTLILSATPIQKRTEEYLPLLALLDPLRYDKNNPEVFQQLVELQHIIRIRVVKLTRLLSEDFFDKDVAEEFDDALDSILSHLKHDKALRKLADNFTNEIAHPKNSKEIAYQIVAHISENYRIERRVIRNRRSSIQDLLPQRELQIDYCYEPGELESEILETIYEYINAYTYKFPSSDLTTEYCRIWLHAASSSPHALLEILDLRITRLHKQQTQPNSLLLDLLSPAPPRLEPKRIEHVIAQAPLLEDEFDQFLSSIQWQLEHWIDETDQLLTKTNLRDSYLPNTNRLAQTINAIHKIMTDRPTDKVIIFSSWLETLEVLSTALEQRYGKGTITQFTNDFPDEQLQINADQFQSSPQCRILLSDELGGEGRNFQVAQFIIHLDLPWTPAQIEQRIGRVDRIGRQGTVYSLVPFAKGSAEEDLFHIWQDAFQLFTHSMSGMEIALEDIQKQLFNAIKHKNGIRHGLHQLVEPMIQQAEQLREEIEEERYFEEAAVDTFRRDEFISISNRFRNGHMLRNACLRWASLAGLHAERNSNNEIITFRPKTFSLASMNKARFLNLPNMEEALRRSGRKNNLVLKGTFNRDIAVRQEELIFFAPGNDPWLDAIIANAIEADRGRCCAIYRKTSELQGSWRGFELLYSLSIDPRPLYQRGYDPIHLFRASGFLRTSTYSLFISETGERISKTGTIGSICKPEYHKLQDVHLGKRDGNRHQILEFKENYPLDAWEAIITRVIAKAETTLSEELEDYMNDVANEAKELYEQQAAGLQATRQWYQENAMERFSWDSEEIEEFKHISDALVEGLRHPIRRLESICYWVLESGK